MFVSQWCYKSAPLEVIGPFSHDCIGCKARVSCHQLLVGFDPSVLCQISPTVSQITSLLEVRLWVSFPSWIKSFARCR